MKSRRDFIKSTAALTLGSIVAPGVLKACSASAPDFANQIGIQTFTTASFTGSDPKAMLQQLAAIGFKNIETATYTNAYYGFSPKELKTIIEDLGMKWIGHHVLGVPFTLLMNPPAEDASPEQQMEAEQMEENARSLDIPASIPNLMENTVQLVDEAAEGGLQYLICASTAIRTLGEINAAVEVFSKAGEACNKAGLQFAYHNHATEWDIIEGTTAYDVILSQTDPDLVKMELDLGWVATAKKDPVELFNGHPGRFPLFHVKDFNLETNTIVPVGQGQVDFTPAFDNADLAGMKYFFYEQDTATSMDEVKLSYDNLKTILS